MPLSDVQNAFQCILQHVGTLNVCNLGQFANAHIWIVLTLFGKYTLCNEAQRSNAYASTVVSGTVSGISIELILQRLKLFFPIVVKAVHFEKSTF